MVKNTTECSGHGLRRHTRERSLGWLDSAQHLLALASFWPDALLLDVQVNQTTTGRADNTSLVGLGVVRRLLRANRWTILAS